MKYMGSKSRIAKDIVPNLQSYINKNHCPTYIEPFVVIVSEQKAPEDWKVIWEKSVSRSIKAADKTVSTEKLFIIKDEKT